MASRTQMYRNIRAVKITHANKFDSNFDAVNTRAAHAQLQCIFM